MGLIESLCFCVFDFFVFGVGFKGCFWGDEFCFCFMVCILDVVVVVVVIDCCGCELWRLGDNFGGVIVIWVFSWLFVVVMFEGGFLWVVGVLIWGVEIVVLVVGVFDWLDGICCWDVFLLVVVYLSEGEFEWVEVGLLFWLLIFFIMIGRWEVGEVGEVGDIGEVIVDLLGNWCFIFNLDLVKLFWVWLWFLGIFVLMFGWLEVCWLFGVVLWY